MGGERGGGGGGVKGRTTKVETLKNKRKFPMTTKPEGGPPLPKRGNRVKQNNLEADWYIHTYNFEKVSNSKVWDVKPFFSNVQK